MELTAYQRGNRDGLLSFAKWADEKANVYSREYEQAMEHVGKNSLSGLRYEMTINQSLIRGEVYRSIAEQARRLAESLPLDPETT